MNPNRRWLFFTDVRIKLCLFNVYISQTFPVTFQSKQNYKARNWMEWCFKDCHSLYPLLKLYQSLNLLVYLQNTSLQLWVLECIREVWWNSRWRWMFTQNRHLNILHIYITFSWPACNKCILHDKYPQCPWILFDEKMIDS